MANTCKLLIYISIILNVILAVGDRLCQIIYYASTIFLAKTAGDTCLAFILIYPFANIIIVLIHMLSQNDFNKTFSKRIIDFFYYLISVEACYAEGVQNSTKNKYHLEADNILLTNKVINAMHLMFVSLPQILIITIHSSSRGWFNPIDIASLFFSSFFFMWSIVYYLLCSIFEDDYLNELAEY
jgi:hypothetical protein